MPNKEKIQDDFYIKYGTKLDDLLFELKEKFRGSKILNDPKITMGSDFVDLILYSIKPKSI